MIQQYVINSQKYYFTDIRIESKEKEVNYDKLIDIYINLIDKYGLFRPKKLKESLEKNGFKWKLDFAEYRSFKK